MNNIDTYRYLVGAYYGIAELDEYNIKEYILKEIQDYIDDFCKANDLSKGDIDREREDVKDNVSLKVKLQDALLVLPKINAPTELVLLVKERLKRIREEELDSF